MVQCVCKDVQIGVCVSVRVWEDNDNSEVWYKLFSVLNLDELEPVKSQK